MACPLLARSRHEQVKSAYRIAANFSRRSGLALGMLWLASLLRHRRKCNVIKREFVPYCQREACATISPISISDGATLATLEVVNSTMSAFGTKRTFHD
jgi:hypothetical protein